MVCMQPFYQGLLERVREQLKRRSDASVGRVYTTMPGLMATIKVNHFLNSCGYTNYI